ncbi:MAG: acyltransferase family protein, partial [Clostridia bacterium]|nr:acyltransferase family protein [Clostridia bacterium]
MRDRKLVLQSITGLRGIACLFIVCYHYFCLFIDDPGLGMEALPFGAHAEFFFVYAKNAVELFFMLAGFLTAYHYRGRIADLSFGAYFKKHYGKLLIPSLIVNAWAVFNELALPSSDIAVTPIRFVLSVLMINTGWFTSYSQTGLPINSTMWFIDVLLLWYLLYYAIRKLTKNRYVYICMCT